MKHYHHFLKKLVSLFLSLALTLTVISASPLKAHADNKVTFDIHVDFPGLGDPVCEGDKIPETADLNFYTMGTRGWFKVDPATGEKKAIDLNVENTFKKGEYVFEYNGYFNEDCDEVSVYLNDRNLLNCTVEFGDDDILLYIPIRVFEKGSADNGKDELNEEDRARVYEVQSALQTLDAHGPFSLLDIPQVEEIRKVYDALPDDLKSHVSPYDYNMLVIAETEIAKLVDADKKVSDRKAADAVIKLINDLPAVASPTQSEIDAVKASLEECRDAYDALTEDQKKLLTEDDLSKLDDLEKTLKAAKEKAEAEKKAEEKTEADKKAAEEKAAKEAREKEEAEKKEAEKKAAEEKAAAEKAAAEKAEAEKASEEKNGDATPTVSYIPVFRLFNAKTGEHFYTVSPAEKENAVAQGYTDEGIGFRAIEWSHTPVIRLFNPVTGLHGYAVRENEIDALISKGYTREGVAWYASAERPVFLVSEERSFNSLLTATLSERDLLRSSGWTVSQLY